MLKTDQTYFKNIGKFLYVWPFFNKMHERVKGFITLSEKLQRNFQMYLVALQRNMKKEKKLDLVLLPTEIFLKGLETHSFRKSFSSSAKCFTVNHEFFHLINI